MTIVFTLADGSKRILKPANRMVGNDIIKSLMHDFGAVKCEVK